MKTLVRLLALYICLLLLTASGCLFNTFKWTLQYSGGGFTSVSAVSQSDAWATGDRMYRYNGRFWTEGPNPDAPAKQVIFLDKNHGWALGSHQIFFFDGTKWTSSFSDSNVDFQDLSVSKSGVWAMTTSQMYGLIGNQWRITALPEFAEADWKAIWSSGPDDVWICGHYITNADYEFGGGMIFHFNGMQWQKSLDTLNGSQQMPSSSSGLNDIAGIDSKHAWAAGEDGIYSYDGASWRKQISAPAPNKYQEKAGFSSIFALDNADVWACGLKLYSFDGGSWKAQLDNSCNGASAFDRTHVWVTAINGIYFGGND